MKESVIVHEKVKDRITFNNEYSFVISLTIGLTAQNDYILYIDFHNQSKEDQKHLIKLSKSVGTITIDSDFLKKEGYNISHLVIEKFTMDSMGSIKWICLSDDIGYKLEIQ